MCGKTLKFPKRAKFVPQDKTPVAETPEKPVSEEEHLARLQKLKDLGLIK